MKVPNIKEDHLNFLRDLAFTVFCTFSQFHWLNDKKVKFDTSARSSLDEFGGSYDQVTLYQVALILAILKLLSSHQRDHYGRKLIHRRRKRERGGRGGRGARTPPPIT